mgnify:CR=1 FL=1
MAKEGIRKIIARAKKEKITFMGIPGARGEVRTITVTTFQLYSFLFFFLFLFTTFFSLYAIFLLRLNESDKIIEYQTEEIGTLLEEKESLEVINDRQQEEIKSLYENSNDLKRQIERLKELKLEIEGIIDTTPTTISLPQTIGEPYLDGKGGGTLQTGSLLQETQAILTLLMRQAPQIEQDFLRLKSTVMEQRRRYDHTPSIWPVEGRISSRFGNRTHPITGRLHHHTGIDIAVNTGTSVKATADGVVYFAGFDSGYGYMVIIDHGYGLKTLYSHNSKLLVKEGEFIKKGKVVALSGSTGVSTGPHLHFEVILDGGPVDPLRYLK